MTIIAVCSPRSGSSTLTRPVRLTRSGGEHPANCRRRELRLWEEAEGRTPLDQLGECSLGMGGNHDHLRQRSPWGLPEPGRQGQAAVSAEVDVDEGYIRS